MLSSAEDMKEDGEAASSEHLLEAITSIHQLSKTRQMYPGHPESQTKYEQNTNKIQT